jgi:hypothetical protein
MEVRLGNTTNSNCLTAYCNCLTANYILFRINKKIVLKPDKVEFALGAGNGGI